MLFRAGVNVVRLNFSHGTHEEHAARIRMVREISADLNKPVTLLQDLRGPKIRTGEIEGGAVKLVRGQPLTLTTERVEGNEKCISIDFEDLPTCVRPGGRILLDDGNLELGVTGIHGNEVMTEVLLGGVLKPHKGVNLPGAKLNIPAFTEKDQEDLEFGIEQGIDAVAMSFVRRHVDVLTVRQAASRLVKDDNMPLIIAKLGGRPDRPETDHRGS
jgi:pyruvate kinase